MQEEIKGVEFANSVAAIDAGVLATGSRHFIDVGCWYGVVSMNIKPVHGVHVAIEAVQEIAQWTQANTPPRIDVRCATVCMPSRWRSTIALDPACTLHTSNLQNQRTAELREYPVGACLAPADFIVEYRRLFDAGVGLKTNIEDHDTDLLAALIAADTWPKFFVCEVSAACRQQWFDQVWHAWRQHFGVPDDFELWKFLPQRTFHIAIWEGHIRVWHNLGRATKTRSPVYEYSYFRQR